MSYLLGLHGGAAATFGALPPFIASDVAKFYPLVTDLRLFFLVCLFLHSDPVLGFSPCFGCHLCLLPGYGPLLPLLLSHPRSLCKEINHLFLEVLPAYKFNEVEILLKQINPPILWKPDPHALFPDSNWHPECTVGCLLLDGSKVFSLVVIHVDRGTDGGVELDRNLQVIDKILPLVVGR